MQGGGGRKEYTDIIDPHLRIFHCQANIVEKGKLRKNELKK